jgi:hypothetical protein
LANRSHSPSGHLAEAALSQTPVALRQPFVALRDPGTWKAIDCRPPATKHGTELPTFQLDRICHLPGKVLPSKALKHRQRFLSAMRAIEQSPREQQEVCECVQIDA